MNTNQHVDSDGTSDSVMNKFSVYVYIHQVSRFKQIKNMLTSCCNHVIDSSLCLMYCLLLYCYNLIIRHKTSLKSRESCSFGGPESSSHCNFRKHTHKKIIWCRPHDHENPNKHNQIQTQCKKQKQKQKKPPKTCKCRNAASFSANTEKSNTRCWLL